MIIGSEKVVLPFKACGFRSIVVSSADEMIRLLSKIAKDAKSSLLLIEDDLANERLDDISEIRRTRQNLVIMEIPSNPDKGEPIDVKHFFENILKIKL